MKILVIDHYDSFTYTIILYLKELGLDVEAIKSDSFNDAKDIEKYNFTHLLLSPGPNSPRDFPQTLKALDFFKKNKKILGICLGHQCIAYYFGGQISKLKYPKHGKTTRLYFKKNILFRGLKQGFKVGLYNSLFVSKMPKKCKVIAKSKEGIIMALKHKKYNIYGIQFHPESILSQYGKKILQNFIET
ncbi:aminodeoxychorismate/anthranilate synthase component II [Helicobacter sp. MIT 14-3879]|uniref:anthranilate synthase component II n=1 Tax=Helicobacter sp. MIT 14-3879 TaxID=2040649 RepID=UPI000E1FB2DA|nr:aminodeoxychorismate/anthranilate synthase component II [Helicobacter sp. MIT 14-3879]RDU65006.1 glutamine amidotransferase [Helicobacter sp. MIT 14-3879]